MNIVYRGDDGRTVSLGETNELRHWKYIKKIPVGKGFRYFYSWDEYKAYLADPTAELQKTGQKAANQLQSAGRRAGQEIKTAKKSTQKYIAKGRKSVEKAVSKADRSKMTVAGVRQANAQRSPSLKQRMNEFAKKASQKWNAGKEAVKETAEKGKKWVEDVIKTPGRKIKEWKEERKRKKIEKEKAEKELRERKLKEMKEKYKYVKKIEINGKTRYFYSLDEVKAYERKEKYQAKEPNFMKDVKHSDVPYTAEEDAIQVNPKFNRHDFDSDYEVNCAECTAIYELRRRGYDVESNGESGYGENADKYNTDKRYDLFYENSQINRLSPTKTDEETVKALEEEFSKMPPGSRGDISCQWKFGGAHSMAWQIDEKGKVHIIDTQVSGHGNCVEYSLEDLAANMDNQTVYKRKQFGGHDTTFWNGRNKVSATRIVRTDNLKLKPEIKNICQDTDDKKRAKPRTTNAWRGFSEETYEMDEKELVTRYSNLMEGGTRRDKRRGNNDIVIIS